MGNGVVARNVGVRKAAAPLRAGKVPGVAAVWATSAMAEDLLSMRTARHARARQAAS